MCSWKFLVFTGDFRIVMSVRETPGSQVSELVFRLVRSGFMKEFEGVWRVSFFFFLFGGYLIMLHFTSFDKSSCHVCNRVRLDSLLACPAVTLGA